MRSQMALLLATLISVYLLMVVGAYVTTGGFGLECPDWPTCNGQLIPPLTSGVLVEYSHRLLTVLTTVLLFATTFALWRVKPRTKNVLTWMELASVLLVIQIFLGGLVVGSELDAVIATIHLANSIIIFGLVVAATVLLRQQRF